jgi:hypothetical protein
MDVIQLGQLVHNADAAALIVEPHLLRRVVRLDRGIQGFRLFLPHRESYTLERDRLLALVERDELGIDPSAELPARLILLSKLDDSDLEDAIPSEPVINRYARPLFHACVHLELEAKFGQFSEWQSLTDSRREQIGDVEFDEIRQILLKDDYLFQSPTDLETYSEFAAVYLELRYFAAHELACYFPAIRDWETIDRLISADVDHGQLFDRLRFCCGGIHTDETTTDSTAAAVPSIPIPTSDPVEFRRLQIKADQAKRVGNSVKALLALSRAAQIAPAGDRVKAQAAALSELNYFAQRLQVALQLSLKDAQHWADALEPLLEPAGRGLFISEARLLYDLQKVCVEQERIIRRVNLVEWILSRGQRPFDRPLPLLCEALVLRHLRTARRRISAARVQPANRERLAALLDEVLPQVEQRLRGRVRHLMADVFDQVGLRPQNVPESVARQKAIEEMIDQIVDRSYLSMADVRDALSKNDLKLPDVTTLSEFVEGDRLLQADEKFDTVLDGVYRRGPVYQRWPQTLSSLAFGTNIGRILTKYVAVPYGGAFLILECLRHLGVLPGGKGHATPATLHPEMADYAVQTSTDWMFLATVLFFGTWISFLIHRPTFLAWNIAVLKGFGRVTRHVLVDVPTRLLHSQYVQQILTSYAFNVVRNYFLRPAVFTALLVISARLLGFHWANRLILEIFLVASLFLNSAVGRYLADAATGYVIHAWHELKIRVIAAVFQWTMDFFRGLLTALERVVYAIDEWLRFRTGDDRVVQVAKLTGGVFWFFLAYVVIFVFTLLVEPQINPIKHFPVVTVSHKLILPTGPVIVQQLTPYLGAALANTLVWTTIWLIPGVFGFLVWELKENWRLYAANRPRVLRSESIGHHGETMMQLLRPGFHSGTLPKAFSALRRAARRSASPDANRLRRRWAAIARVEASVKRFVERELMALLNETGFTRRVPIAVGQIHASTNRIEVTLAHADWSEQPACLAWEYHDGHLTGAVEPLGWIDSLQPSQREELAAAVAGLFQRSGVEYSHGLEPRAASHPITWTNWVATWQQSGDQSQGPELRGLAAS